MPPFFCETQEDVEIVYLLKKVEEALDKRDDEVFEGDLFSSSLVIYVLPGFKRSYSLVISNSYFLAC